MLAWLHEDAHQKILSLLNQEGGQGRFVGSAVRDSLLGKEPADFDVATTHRPEAVQRLARASGYAAHPTGIAHGTVTVVIQGRPYEITTLRTDDKTDGRHAQVSFTKSFEDDAKRRDLTINALYADADGKIYDYTTGLDDLKAGIVRFIGDSKTRVQEDYLRILRFFRFHVRFAKTDFDPSSLQACLDFKERLAGLSKERIGAELKKLLLEKDIQKVSRLFYEQGIWKIAGAVTPLPDFNLFGGLCDLEGALKETAAPMVRLKTIYGPHMPQFLLERKAQKLWKAMNVMVPFSSDKDALLIQLRLASFKADALFARPELFWLTLARALVQKKVQPVAAAKIYQDLAGLVSENKPFPLGGTDLLTLGVEGKEVGRILKAIQVWWIEQGEKPGQADCLQKAKQLLQDI